jgi:hypothetical protein
MPVIYQKQERTSSSIPIPHPTGYMLLGLLLDPVSGKRGQYRRVAVLEFPAHHEILDRSLHASTVSEQRYLTYDGHEQYTIDIV